MRSSSLGNILWISLAVFGLFCYSHFVIKQHAVCWPKSQCQSVLSTVGALAKRSLHQDLMHSGCRGTSVPNVCLQAFLLSLSPVPTRPKACSQARPWVWLLIEALRVKGDMSGVVFYVEGSFFMFSFLQFLSFFSFFSFVKRTRSAKHAKAHCERGPRETLKIKIIRQETLMSLFFRR